ncbi:hypothetical protein ACWKWC_19425 [Geodermatophilus nigrescens]
MTEPSRPRPVPGPPRPGPAADPARASASVLEGLLEGLLGGLDERPVAEHVAVFEAEHDRLARELATIDQL